MSGDVIPLPSGATALFRDAKQVPERLRRPILAAAPQINEAADARDVTLLRDIGDLAILAFVVSWTVNDEKGERVPVSADAVLDLPGMDYDALSDAAMSRIGDLFPSFSEPDVDPESPTDA